MLLRRMNSFNQLGRELDRVFGDLVPQVEVAFDRFGSPPLNIWEDGDQFFVEAEIPGFRMEDIEVEVLDNELSLRGRMKTENQEVKYHRRERTEREFARTVELPAGVNVNGVEATLKNGVLTIKLPKTPETKATKVQVKNID